MERVAIFVDAGYLYAAGAKAVTGADGTKRHEIALDIPKAISYLLARAEAISQQKLLRIYWYDAAPSSRLTTDHQILASSDNVKLRLGVINGFGQQKGVDGKIITDITELSRNRAFADAVLLGGDEDLRIGVELAQEYGTRVHLFLIEGGSSSPTLRQESDTVNVLAKADIEDFLTVKPPLSHNHGLALVASEVHPTSFTPASTSVPIQRSAEDLTSQGTLHTGVSVLTGTTLPGSAEAPTHAQPAIDPSIQFAGVAQDEIRAYITSLSAPEHVALTSALKTGAGVPAEHDGRLLARTRRILGRPLDQPEKAKLRRLLKSEMGL